MEQFGGKIKEYRQLAGLTQEQVAKKLNIGRSTYTKYELNAITPSLEVLELLAGIFGVSFPAFLEHLGVKQIPWDEYDKGSNRDKLIFWATSLSDKHLAHLVDLAEHLYDTADFNEYIEGNAWSLGLSRQPDPAASELDSALLAAYHAAPAEIRTIVDTALDPYKAKLSADSAAS